LKRRQRWWRELWDQRVSSVIMTKTKKIWMLKVSKLLTTLSKEGIKVVDNGESSWSCDLPWKAMKIEKWYWMYIVCHFFLEVVTLTFLWFL
jgi:hypothetical protein